MHFSEALTCVADCASRDNRETDNLRKVDTVEQRQSLIYKLTSEEGCRLWSQSCSIPLIFIARSNDKENIITKYKWGNKKYNYHFYIFRQLYKFLLYCFSFSYNNNRNKILIFQEIFNNLYCSRILIHDCYKWRKLLRKKNAKRYHFRYCLSFFFNKDINLI